VEAEVIGDCYENTNQNLSDLTVSEPCENAIPALGIQLASQRGGFSYTVIFVYDDAFNHGVVYECRRGAGHKETAW
jgi:hypothetical protein